MILLEPFPLGRPRDAMLRTVIRAESLEDIEAVYVLRFYTAEVIKDKRKDEKSNHRGNQT